MTLDAGYTRRLRSLVAKPRVIRSVTRPINTIMERRIRTLCLDAVVNGAQSLGSVRPCKFVGAEHEV